MAAKEVATGTNIYGEEIGTIGQAGAAISVLPGGKIVGKAAGGLATIGKAAGGAIASGAKRFGDFLGFTGKNADEVAGAAKGASFGGSGATKIVAQDGTNISGYTKHGLNRAIGDGAKRAGVKPAAILDALKNPKKITSGIDKQGRPFKIYQGENARVIINPDTGRIVSMNPISGEGVR